MPYRCATVVALFLILVFVANVGPATAAYGFRKAITIDNTKVGGAADLTDFPVLVSLTDLDLKTTANGGHVENSSGFDIVFRQACTTTNLDHEIEKYDPVTGTLVAWVKVPVVYHDTDTLIEMDYGDAAIVSSQENVAGVWDASYAGVWHLSQPSGAGAYIRNSAQNDHHGTPTNTAFTASGKIDGARTFVDGSTQRIDLANGDALFDGWSQFAFEFWIYPDYASDAIWQSAGEHAIMSYDSGTLPVRLARVRRGGGEPAGKGTFQVDVQFAGAGTQYETVTIDRRQWNHVVYRYDGTRFKTFVNSVPDGNVFIPGDNLINSSAFNLHLGHSGAALRGSLDEVRISDSSRSDGWIQTEYNNQSSPATFYTVGPELAAAACVTNYRSIGTAADYSVNTVAATNGSALVDGVGTAWKSANRGRGDRMNIAGVDYTVLAVHSETQLTLTSPYMGTTGTGKAYTLARQFTTLQGWEDCISFGTPCTFFPVGSASLVADSRSEVGVAYNDTVFTNSVSIAGATTSAAHTIQLTADDINRHYGLPGTGTVLDISAAGPALSTGVDYATVEWLEIANVTSLYGILVNGLTGGPSSQIVLRNNLVHNVSGSAIEIQQNDIKVDIIGNIESYSQVGVAITSGALQPGSRYRILNNTVYGNTAQGVLKSPGASLSPTLLLQNNISIANSGNAFDCDLADSLDPASSSNLSVDATCISCSPAGGGLQTSIASLSFVNAAAGDLHINSGSAAENIGADLSSVFYYDIDGGFRQSPWDIGADDIAATTAVELVGFTASGEDGSVLLEWQTATELNNLGFHVLRSSSEQGPYQRITEAVIPGLGSSPVGARYRYRDRGLVNGVTYYYELEDIETTGASERHGPVSATTRLATPTADESESSESSLITYGDPTSSSLRVLKRTRSGVVLELRTEGFYAEPAVDGSVRLEVPDFEELSEAGAPGVPVKRSWVEALAGRKVRLASVRPHEVEAFTGLRPTDADTVELVANETGTVRAARQKKRRLSRVFNGDGLYPVDAGRLVSVGFQGETKKALVELAPLRWNESTGELLLARRLVVHLSFQGRDASEQTTNGVTGRRYRGKGIAGNRGVVARLSTHEPGVYGVRFEEVFPPRRAVRTNDLRLSRLGDAVAFHIEPNPNRFRRGSTLYFLSEGEAVNPYEREAVYELQVGLEGEAMELIDGAPSGEMARDYWHHVSRDENRYYQAALLEAPDLWLWDVLVSPVRKSYEFQVSDLAPLSTRSRLSVWLQGASDLAPSPSLDHHVRAYVNGTFVGESSWDGKNARKLEAEILPGVVREGTNSVELESVGDTEAEYSLVMLDRFTVDYPRVSLAEGGELHGTWQSSGTAEVEAVGPGIVLDVTEVSPRWLEGVQSSANGALRFHADAGSRYWVVGSAAVKRAEIRRPERDHLTSTRNRADYIVIGPRAFLDAASPLIEMRRRQALRVKAVSTEEIYETFGYGERRPEAIQEFLAYAYHRWRQPSLRYVVLLGDASFDFKDYLGTAVENQVPPFMVRTSHLWTASDPAYAAVNGEDLLPDVAIGRLPAATVHEARTMVDKILRYENGDATLEQTVVLIADNADEAGNFEADAEALASGVLASHRVKKVFASDGTAATRNAIADAFDNGASLMSYMGHGGIHLWADENVLNIHDIDSLSPQTQQPILLTMNCLNGYFHFPYFDSLSEALLKAEGKGAIAAFSPSGLSLNGPAHRFHVALLEEILHGNHERLGDAVLAAQEAYADTGALPELLSIYQLLGDPALVLR